MRTTTALSVRSFFRQHFFSLQSLILRQIQPSPDECRVNIEVRNLDAWYSAFHVSMGEKLYLNLESRVRIW
jgi:predicted metalloendopeptidase